MSLIKFDRNELAGAFGDIGTDFPLIVGITIASGMNSCNVLVTFGFLQILTGFIYRMPMPVQPLKAMAAIIIAQKVAGPVICGAGLMIGIIMLLLTFTGLVELTGKLIPVPVIRGVQFGLGLQLAFLSMKDYIPADGISGYLLAVAAAVLFIMFIGDRKKPVVLWAVLIGLAYAFIFKMGMRAELVPQLSIPKLNSVNSSDLLTGLFLLSLPQLPLSLGNSLLATRKVAEDLFPERPLSLRKIGFTYSLMNIIAPFLGGIPVCHGSGGMVGHYTFGGRTGGSVVIYGMLYIILGLFFSHQFDMVLQYFPLPLLGVILLFEALFIALLIRDQKQPSHFLIAMFTGIICSGLKYGFVVGMLIGTAVFYLSENGKIGLTKN